MKITVTIGTKHIIHDMDDKDFELLTHDQLRAHVGSMGGNLCLDKLERQFAEAGARS